MPRRYAAPPKSTTTSGRTIGAAIGLVDEALIIYAPSMTGDPVLTLNPGRTFRVPV